MQLPKMARRQRAKHICKSKSSKHYGLGVLLQLQKMARRLRAKHIWKSKTSKRYGLGVLFEDATSQNGTPPAREAHLEVKIVKTLRSRNTFGGCNFQTWHAACARSTFGSQNRQSTTVLEHFFKMQLQTMARRQRAKHICKSKSSKPYGLGALFQDATLKNGTSPAHEAHLEVKSVKAHR